MSYYNGKKYCVYKVNELFDSTELKDQLEIPYLQGEVSPEKISTKVEIDGRPIKNIDKLPSLVYREIYWAKYLQSYMTEGSNIIYLQNENEDELGYYLLRIEIKPIGKNIKVTVVDLVQNKKDGSQDGRKSSITNSDIYELLKFIKTHGYKHFKRWSENVAKTKGLKGIKNWNIDGMKTKADLNSMKYIKKFSDI